MKREIDIFILESSDAFHRKGVPRYTNGYFLFQEVLQEE